MVFAYILINDNNISVISVPALPYGDDNNDIYSNDDYEDVAASSASGGEAGDGGEQVIHTLPQFKTAGQSLLVNEGSTIKLPCNVNRLGKSYS